MAVQYPNVRDSDYDLIKKIAANTAEIADGGALPDQTGHAGEFLNTDGTNAQWLAIPGGGDMLAANNLSDVDSVSTSRTNLGLVAIASTGSASDLSAGTVPDARFPATLPALSGVNLTALNASNLGSGTVPDARFPATLPAISGANLTNLDASDLASGIIPDARMPNLTGDVTTVEGAVATTIANGAVTLAKMADLAQDQFIGRTTASTGVPETATITAAARTVLDDATVAAMVNTLGGATSVGTGGLVRETGAVLSAPIQTKPVSAHATTPNSITTAQVNTAFINEGATELIVENLPGAAAGLQYTWVVQDADGFQVVAAAGDTIRIASSVSAAAGNIQSTTIGSSVTLLAINATEWIAIAHVGTWGVT